MYLCRACYADKKAAALRLAPTPYVPAKRIKGEPPIEASVPETLHQRIIHKIRLDLPQFKVSGFMRLVRTLIDDDDDDAGQLHCTPDLYHWDGKWALTAVEVIDHSDIDENKISKYVEIFWALDAEGYRLRLITVNRHWAVGEVPLFALAFGQPIEIRQQPNLRWQFAPLGYCDAPDAG